MRWGKGWAGRAAALIAGVCVVLTAMPVQADYTQGLDAYRRGDYYGAFTQWQGPAQAGDPKAQLGLGILYHTGQGVSRNLSEAKRWYEQAAREGVVNAIYNLGLLAMDSSAGATDPNKALQHWQQASQGDKGRAAHNIGVLYYKGVGVAQNPLTAARWFRKGAEAGYADSQYFYGEMLSHGIGVDQDQGEAVRWLTLARLQGHPQAEQRLQAMGALGTSMAGSSSTSIPAQTGASLGTPASRSGQGGGSMGRQGESRASAGGPVYHVWLESFSSRQKAQRHWTDVQRAFPDLFGRLQSSIREVTIGGNVYYRLLGGPLQGQRAAEDLCQRLKSRAATLNCKPMRDQS